jgi:four helix bundle protein
MPQYARLRFVVSGTLRTFEDLEAWKSARELTNLTYGFFRRLPASRDFGLRDQVQRAAVSAMTNVAEGFERLHLQEKIQFYNIARASCGEVRSLAYVMRDAGYISDAEHRQLKHHAIHSGSLITGLLRSTAARKS